MRRFSIVVSVAVLIVGVLVAVPAAAADKSGIIDGEVWTADDGPFNITGPLIVHELEIREGTEVVVQGNYPITVSGRLDVEGDAEDPVTFTYKSETASGWQGINFADTQEGTTITGADISYASTGLTTNQGAWTIEDSHLHDNNVGASIVGAPGSERTGRFRRNLVAFNETGVRVRGQVDRFEHNTISENDEGLSFLTTSGSYSENNIFGNEVEATTCDFVGMGEVDATDNFWGTDESDEIEDVICDGNDDGNEVSPKIDFDGYESQAIPEAPLSDDVSPSPSASPSSSPSTRRAHARTVTLTLRRHLRARGQATVVDGFAECMPASVAIDRRRRDGSWVNVKVATVGSTGAYATRLRDRRGAYRATLQAFTTATDDCQAATSPVVRHRHD